LRFEQQCAYATCAASDAETDAALPSSPGRGVPMTNGPEEGSTDVPRQIITSSLDAFFVVTILMRDRL
jgi:hypothetical protein